MNWRQFRRHDANIQFKRKNRQSVMFHDTLKPFPGWMRKLQFAFGCLEADFKAADGGNIDRRGLH